MRLIVGNSFSQLLGVSAVTLKALKGILFYEVDPAQAYFGGGHHDKKRYLIDAKGSFPTGLLGYVLEYLQQEAPDTMVEDTRKRPTATPAMFKLDLG